MDLPAYSESFKFWLQFFSQKPQLASSMQEPQSSELLADFWTLFQLQQHYSAALGLANASANGRTQFELDELAKQSCVSSLMGQLERCAKPLLSPPDKSAGIVPEAEPSKNQNQNQNQRSKRAPKRLHSGSCASRHSPASSSVSASPGSSGVAHGHTSSAQPQPIIKMDLSKEEIAEITCELNKIENRIGPYKCMLCMFTFDDAIQLACHSCPNIVNVEYRCQECSKVFNCPANLASHRRWHKRRLVTVTVTGAGAGVGACANSTLPTFANTLTSPVSCGSTVSTYEPLELPVPAKREANQNASANANAIANQNAKQPARFSVEFLLGCKLPDADSFGKSARGAEIETS